MKYILKKILTLYPYSAFQSLIRYRNIIYTHWIKTSFAVFGRNSHIESGLRLWGGEHITIGNSVVIRRYTNLSAWSTYMGVRYYPVLHIGNYCSIGEYANISSIYKVILGEHVLLGRWVTIIDHSHGIFDYRELCIPPDKRLLHSKGPVIIDDNVWIADKVTICPNVHIHTGAIVGANSVVTKDVPAYTMVAGNPAIIIKVIEKYEIKEKEH